MKKTAKLITLILAVSFIFGAFGVSVYAENSATVTVGTAKAAAGETVKVDVSISDCEGFSSYTIHITYDSEYVTAVEAKKGINAMLYMPNLSVGGRKEIAIVGGDVNNITQNGVIATITFKIADDFPGGITEIPLKIITNKITEYNGSKDVAIDSRSVDGKLIISGAGTVVWNGDGGETELTPAKLTDEEAAGYKNPITGESVTGGDYYINEQSKIALPAADVEEGVKSGSDAWKTVDEPSGETESDSGSSEPAQGSEDAPAVSGAKSWVLIGCIAGGAVVVIAGVIAIIMITKKKGGKQD